MNPSTYGKYFFIATKVKTYLISTLFFALSGFMVACQGNGTAVKEFDAQAADVRLHGRIAGNPKSKCVLIAINGGPGLTSNYMLDLERLAGPDCAVVTYDQRGLGKSSQPDNPDSSDSYTLPKYAQDLEAIRLAVKAERVHLFGHSFGGIVAMQYAILHPERVASLIFFGGGPPTWEDIAICDQSMMARVQALMQSGVLAPPSEGASFGMEQVLPAYFSDPTFTFPEDSLGGPPEFNQKVRDLTWTNLEGMDFREELANFRMRVLLMWGRDDPFNIATAEATRQALVNAQVDYEIIERCGHFWHECPDAFYPRLREFLKKK